MRNILLVGLLGASLYVMRTVSSVQNLDYKLVGLKLNRLEPTYLDTTISFQIANPSPSALRFSDFKGSIYYKGKLLSTVFSKAESLIRPQTGKIVHIRAPIGIESSLHTVADIINSRALQPFRITGTIKLNGVTYPFDQEIQADGS